MAIARCITRDPKLFLMDEPFSNLDAKLRERYRLQLKRLLQEFSITTVYVTHDQLEARILADIVVVMRDGNIVQTGTYEEIYSSPVNIFVGDFLNINAETPAINLIPGGALSPEYEGSTIGFRCEHARVVQEKTENAVQAKILYLKKSPFGKEAVYHLQSDSGELYAESPLLENIQENSTVWVYPEKFHVFSVEDGLRIETIQR